jgi:hypothetical protein
MAALKFILSYLDAPWISKCMHTSHVTVSHFKVLTPNSRVVITSSASLLKFETVSFIINGNDYQTSLPTD